MENEKKRNEEQPEELPGQELEQAAGGLSTPDLAHPGYGHSDLRFLFQEIEAATPRTPAEGSGLISVSGKPEFWVGPGSPTGDLL